MPVSVSLDSGFRGCGVPSSTSSDILAWNSLAGGSTKAVTTIIKVGIFGYDITCIAEYCAGLIKQDYYGYCPLIAAKGLDGLAFGIHW